MISTKRLFTLGFGILVVVLLGVWLRSDRKSSETVVQCDVTSVAQQYAAADLVLTGEVFLVVPDTDGMAKVLITPSQVYKGKVPTAGVSIAAREGLPQLGDPANAELHFASGQPPYLLYLEERADGLFTTSRCLGSRLLGEGLSSEEQQILGIGQGV